MSKQTQQVNTEEQAKTEVPTTEQKPNKLLMEFPNERIALHKYPTEKAWDIACDVVDYPVVLGNAYYKTANGYQQATGLSPSGREKHFNLVLVDRFRTGEYQAIAAPTDTYSSLHTQQLYIELNEALKESPHKAQPKWVYVSGNGGVQMLCVEMPGLTAIDGVPDKLTLRILLETSVDGTRSHTLSAVIHNEAGNFDSHIYGGVYGMSARHTKTIEDRVEGFTPWIEAMVNNWNDMIIPTMILMNDEKFDKEVAVELIDRLAKEAGIGQRRRENIVRMYETDEVRTNAKGHNLYRVNAALSQYIEEEVEDRPDLQMKFRNEVAKQVNKEVRKAQVKQEKKA